MGRPDGDGCQATPANLSPPRAENCRHRSSCSTLRTLTQNLPVAAMSGQLVEALSGRKATSGGSSDTDVKVPTTIPPAGRPDASALVMTETPVGQCPSTWRKVTASMTSASAIFLFSLTGRLMGLGTTALCYLLSI